MNNKFSFFTHLQSSTLLFLLNFFFIFLVLLQHSFASNLNEEEDLSSLSFESSKPNIYDPYEKYNRKIYIFNEKIDIYFFEKIAYTFHCYKQCFFKRRLNSNWIQNKITNHWIVQN